MAGQLRRGLRLFLVESYTPTTRRHDTEAAADRISAAAASLTAKGATVRHIASVLVAADETTFHLFEAADPTTVATALRRASIEFERLVEAEVT